MSHAIRLISLLLLMAWSFSQAFSIQKRIVLRANVKIGDSKICLRHVIRNPERILINIPGELPCIMPTPIEKTKISLSEIKAIYADLLFNYTWSGSSVSVQPELKRIKEKDIEEILLSSLFNSDKENLIMHESSRQWKKIQDLINHKYKVELLYPVYIPKKSSLEINKDSISLEPGQKSVLNNTALYEEFGMEPPKLKFLLKKRYKKYKVSEGGVAKGERITNSNFSTSHVFSAEKKHNYMRMDPLGAIAIKDLQQGSLITQNDVVFRYDVKRGRRIRLRYSHKGMYIETIVFAAEAGIIGRTIKLSRKKNRAIIYANLINKNEAVFISNEKN